MSQFDEVMAKLDEIIQMLDLVIYKVGHPDDEGESLFGEDPFDPNDYGPAIGDAHHQAYLEPEGETVIRPQMPGVTRRRVEVRGTDGKIEQVDISLVDPYLMQIVEASLAAGTFWMLYRDPSGAIRITAEDQIINTIQRKQPHDDSPDRDTGR